MSLNKITSLVDKTSQVSHFFSPSLLCDDVFLSFHSMRVTVGPHVWFVNEIRLGINTVIKLQFSTSDILHIIMCFTRLWTSLSAKSRIHKMHDYSQYWDTFQRHSNNTYWSQHTPIGTDRNAWTMFLWFWKRLK